MAYSDILIDPSTNRCLAVNGDFPIGDASNLLQYYLIASAPGHIKEFPLVGANASQYINGQSTPASIERAIRSELTKDVFPDAWVDASQFPIVKTNKIQIKLS
jgi:hypothetical protein